MDRFKFRLPVKCRKCGKSSFRFGTLSPTFRIVEDGDGSCQHCHSYCIDVIERGRFEQCTGLKDRDGKLIFEGDKVAIKCEMQDLEIIGNIHEEVPNEKQN